MENKTGYHLFLKSTKYSLCSLCFSGFFSLFHVSFLPSFHPPLSSYLHYSPSLPDNRGTKKGWHLEIWRASDAKRYTSKDRRDKQNTTSRKGKQQREGKKNLISMVGRRNGEKEKQGEEWGSVQGRQHDHSLHRSPLCSFSWSH